MHAAFTLGLLLPGELGLRRSDFIQRHHRAIPKRRGRAVGVDAGSGGWFIPPNDSSRIHVSLTSRHLEETRNLQFGVLPPPGEPEKGAGRGDYTHRTPQRRAQLGSEAKPVSVTTPGSLGLSVPRRPTEWQPRPQALSRGTRLSTQAAGHWRERPHPCWPPAPSRGVPWVLHSAGSHVLCKAALWGLISMG